MNDFNKELKHSPFDGQLLAVKQFPKCNNSLNAYQMQYRSRVNKGRILDSAWANTIQYIFKHYCYISTLPSFWLLT